MANEQMQQGIEHFTLQILGLNDEVKRLRTALETIKNITSNQNVYDRAEQALKGE